MVDDLRYAVRSLLSSRGFTVVALLVIALSIGAITPIFSIVDAVSLRQLPYPEADRLVIVRDNDQIFAARRPPTAPQNYLDWRERQQVFEGLAAVRGGGGQIPDGQGGLLALSLSRVSGEFFSVMRQIPQFGRAVTLEDERSGRPVAVLSHGLWQRLFGGKPDVIGETLTINTVPHEVVGVARRDFIYPVSALRGTDVFVPLTIPPRDRSRAQRGIPYLIVIGRLADGVSLPQARASMETIARELHREHPDWDAGAWVVPYRDFVAGPVARWMRLLLWAMVLVFLIMCANVANLLLARGGSRRRELAVRSALGASRRRIARQLVLEGLVLALAGTAIGVAVGWWALEGFRSAMPAGIPRADGIALDWRLLFTAAAAAVITGVGFGLAPAIFSTRIDLSSALKSSGAGITAAAGGRLRSLLIVGEVAVALVLLFGALLFTASFMRVTSVPLGVDYQNVVTTAVQRPPVAVGPLRDDGSRAVLAPRSSDPWARNNSFHDLVARIAERARAVPGVDDVAASSGAPFGGAGGSFSFGLPGRPDFEWSRDRGMVTLKLVSSNYHDLLRIPLLRGRYLTETDTRNAPGAAVVSETAARMIWPGEDPLGQEIDLQKRHRVVGIVADVRMSGPEVDPWPDIYVPLVQGVGTTAGTLLVRTSLPAGRLLPSLRAAIREIDPSQKVDEATTLEAGLGRLLAQRRFNMLVVGAFGLLGLLIAAIGLYGVMAYLVTQRSHEIGIRMALGASRARVLRLVLGRAALLSAAGLAIGGAGIWYFSAVARAFLFELEPLDARVIAAAVSLMAVTAFAAAVIPARRAASVDPLIALRQD